MVETKHSIAHATRNYESSQYILPSDDIEQERLNRQHCVIRRACGGKLYFAPIHLHDGDRVLESGVGTGQWVLEFASEVSDQVEIQGIDIASRLFPASYPANVHLSTQSIISLPIDWTSKYAYAHQRLLLGALTIDMWKSALSEIFRALKPGGWVELVETSGRIPHVGPCSIKLESMKFALYAHKNLLVDHKKQLNGLLVGAGFVDINCIDHPVPIGESAGEHGLDARTNFTDVVSAMKTPMLNAGGFGLVVTEEEFEQDIINMKEEWKQSDGTIEVFTYYAQKPFVNYSAHS